MGRRRCWAGSEGPDSPEAWAFLPVTCTFPHRSPVLAMVAEFFGGLGLILGFLTRIAAFGIAVNMVVAVAMVHSNFGFFMNWSGTQKGEGFEYHLLALAITAFLMIRGAGAFSLDRVIATTSHTAQPSLAHS